MKASEYFRQLQNSPVAWIARYYTDVYLRNQIITTLGEHVVEIKTGKTPSKSQPRFYETRDINWYKPEDIGKSMYLEDTDSKLSKFAINSNQVTLYKANTLLINCIGDIGRVAIAKQECSSNQQITGVLFSDDLVPEFAFYYFLSHRHLIEADASSTTLPIVNQKKLLSIPFIKPTFKEQKEIVSLLNYTWRCWENNKHPDIDGFDFQQTFKYQCQKFLNTDSLQKSLLFQIGQQQSYLQLLRQTILQEAVQGKLTKQDVADEPASELLRRIKAQKQKLIKEGKLKKEKELPPITEDGIPFGLPKGWVWCRLSDISYVGNGSTPDKSQFTNNESDIPYLKVYNIVSQKVNFYYKPQYIKSTCHYGQLKRSITYGGDVLMNIVGPPLGKIAIVPDEIRECNINQAIVVIRPFVQQLNQWIYYFLCEQSAINSIVTKGTAGQDNISVTQSRNIVFPLPPLPEQQRIVTKVQQLQQQLNALETQVQLSLQYARQLLQAVLKEAFEVNKKEYATNEQLTMAAEE